MIIGEPIVALTANALLLLVASSLICFTEITAQPAVFDSILEAISVTLSDGSYVEGECSCPDDAPTCKHIVAAVLASADVEDAAGEQAVSTLLDTAAADELQSLLQMLADEHMEVRKRIYEELS